MMKEQFQIKDKFFDLIVKNPSRDGFKTFLKESCGELDNIDFKEKWITKGKLAKIMLAMANTGGGVIVLGIQENKDDNYLAVGIDELKDAADVEKEIKKLVPRNLSYSVLNFIYDDEIYGEYAGKKFQAIIIADAPEQLPFFSIGASDDIEKDCVYVRRGTSSEKASARDFETMIQRKLENVFKESNDLSLKEHLEQLQFLYDSIPQKKRILVKKGNRFVGAMEGLQALSERMTEIFGEPDQYEEVPNENYPSEDYEQFLVRMIDKKKLKIEKILDLK
ncbi:MAG: ATP-binding protein [Lachnospiraceae bacterium]|nr:ATP-binding protein [Lachnospiraceae bacterium]